MPRNHPIYEQGYADGYQSGYNFALEAQVEAAKKSAQPAVTITAPVEVVNVARTDLARKVIETVEARKRPYDPRENGEYNDAIHDALTALRELFRVEGVEIK